MKKPKPDDGPTEVKYAECGGTGYPPVWDVAPGRRIYQAPCKKCGGKGRLIKAGQPESSTAARVRR